MTVRVRAGTTVAELDAALGRARPDASPCPTAPGATVGGVLAVGRSGLRRLGRARCATRCSRPAYVDRRRARW